MVGIALAALVLALSAGVAHAVFGSLTFVELERDGVAGVDGLDGASEPVVSPDGKHVYVATQIPDSAVATFSRNASTGALAFLEVDKDGVGGVDGLEDANEVAISPDGASVYAVSGGSDDAVAAFSRNSSSGALTFVEAQKDGVGGVDGLAQASDVAVSPDGDHVYVTGSADNAVATFSRTPSTGALAFVEVDKDGDSGVVDGLGGATGVAVTPDGAHVYVASATDDAVAAFSRNPSTGALAFLGQQKDGVNGVDGLDGATAVAASPGGAHIYAVSDVDNAVATFSRDPSTGALTFVEQDKDGVGGVDGLDGAIAVTPSPDGAHVYAAGFTDGAVATFARSSSTGALTFVEQDKDGVGGVDGLDGARGVGASPDGANVYVAGFTDDAVAAFAREGPPPPPDGGPGPGPGPGAGPLTLDLEAKKQELKKKLKFFATASAKSTLVAKGKAIKATTKELAADEKTKVKAKLKRAKRRQLAKRLEEKGKAKTKVKAKATDQSGADATDMVKVKLKD